MNELHNNGNGNGNGRSGVVIDFLFENSLFLIGGTILALVWANTNPDSYKDFVKYEIVASSEGDKEERDKAHHQHHHNVGEEHSHDFEKNGDKDHTHDKKEEKRSTEERRSGPSEEPNTQEGEKAKEDGAEKNGRSGDNDHHKESERDHSEETSHGSGGHGENEHGEDGHGAGGHAHPFDIQYLINDVLMALFFAIAAKEIWEAMLPRGALSDPKKAATPLFATVGGIVGPAGFYYLGAMFLGQTEALGKGWAIPCATDIAFSYLIARIIFGARHPAIAFLLLLAIADDAAGLVIIAVFYPKEAVDPTWFLLTVAAMGIAYGMAKARLHSFWWYILIPGVLSWYSFTQAHIHPALGLIPIIPFLPHAHTDVGIFAKEELGRHDTLNEFEHWFEKPVEIILGLFGLVNAGVLLSSVGHGTTLVLVGLFVGKPVGIALFTLLGEKAFGLKLPVGMNYRHIITIGCIAGIGFTVALFVTGAAFDAKHPNLDELKMGALLSFGASVISLVVAKALGVKQWTDEDQKAANAAAKAEAS
ncbi:MAG: Na+/H+ antiporter NhaA [Pirellulaceae bacterium]|nr:Na+/H+ antiporter NhaA [Pirellulaceae bacterium]